MHSTATYSCSVIIECSSVAIQYSKFHIVIISQETYSLLLCRDINVNAYGIARLYPEIFRAVYVLVCVCVYLSLSLSLLSATFALHEIRSSFLRCHCWLISRFFFLPMLVDFKVFFANVG